MKLLPLLGLAVGLALPLTAQAQREIDIHARTAGQLAALCSANPREAGSDARRNYCHGFAQGVVDLELMHSKAFCLPKGVRRDATLEQFVGWVNESSARRDQNPVEALLRFLRERYPCH